MRYWGMLCCAKAGEEGEDLARPVVGCTSDGKPQASNKCAMAQHAQPFDQ